MERNLKEDLKSKIQKFKKTISDKKKFTLEINLTEKCNFNCEYCFEGNDKTSGKSNILSSDPSSLIIAIYTLLDDSWFNQEFGLLQIVFWGGEPTMNMHLMRIIINEFKDNHKVSFMIYTNGSRIDKLLPAIEPIKDKIKIQISYDGNPVHDKRRKIGNSPTSDIVINGMELLHENGFEFKLKSTISPKDFKYMSMIWDDIYSLFKRFGSNIGYAPTIDYYNEDYKDEYLDNLTDSLLDIAVKEIKLYNRYKYVLLTWFTRNNKSICGSGRTMAAINIDGEVYFCHGAFYNNGVPLKYSNIFDAKQFVKAIKNNKDMLERFIYDDGCERCVATTCLRCNYAKYLKSQKENLIDRFYDFKCQKDLCNYYKLIGKICRAFRYKIKEEML